MDTDFVWGCSGQKINPDYPLDRANVDRLKESIREHGILTPLVLETAGPRVKKFNLPYFLIDGNHRLKAALELGLKTVPVRKINTVKDI